LFVKKKWFGEKPGPRIGMQSNIALMLVELRNQPQANPNQYPIAVRNMYRVNTNLSSLKR
jgi:hypothetical protein